MKYILICLLMLSISSEVNSCKADRKEKQTDCTSAKIVDMSGLDGCTWMIALENGNKLQPTNLQKYIKQEDLKDQLKVCITYSERPDMMGICMAGSFIEIFSLEISK